MFRQHLAHTAYPHVNRTSKVSERDITAKLKTQDATSEAKYPALLAIGDVLSGIPTRRKLASLSAKIGPKRIHVLA